MDIEKVYKIVVICPDTHADVVRDAIGKAGAGKIGNYDYCSFSVKGTTRFRPLAGSEPSEGEIGQLVEIEEERIETVCQKEKLKAVIEAIHMVHPYEEPAIDVYPVLKL